jgi:predicted DNA-binding transcriptional regulator AlpA
MSVAIEKPAVIGPPAANPRLNRLEAAEYCGCSLATLETKASRGGGPPFIKVGAKVVYLQRDLDAWLNSRRVTFSAQLS